MVKRTATASRKAQPPAKRQKTQRTQFGPVSAITTAPVAIGNSLRGARPVVSVTADGCRIQGRDFAFQAGATAAAVTDWTLIGGLPLTPSVMPATALKSYAQMYAQFRFNALAVHYITSSATSQTGDVMFYYERDRAGPAIDSTSTSFLPFVLSDANTVLGPQWMNHTAMVRPDPEFKSTDYGVNPDLNEEANGTVFLYSKTTGASSPGYVIIDYDITFKQLQVNPRAGILPVTRGQWTPTALQFTGTVTPGSIAAGYIAGNQVSGSPAILPTGTQTGDVFKCIADVTNSTIVNPAWTIATTSTLFAITVDSTNLAVTIDDGFTFYAVYRGTYFVLYASLTDALTGSGVTGKIVHGSTGTVVATLCCELSMVGSVNSRLQNSY